MTTADRAVGQTIDGVDGFPTTRDCIDASIKHVQNAKGAAVTECARLQLERALDELRAARRGGQEPLFNADTALAAVLDDRSKDCQLDGPAAESAREARQLLLAAIGADGGGQ